MIIERRVEVDRPVHEVFAYLSDFTTSTEWDPGTVKTVRADGGTDAPHVGSRYHNVSKFLGRETELTYEIIELKEDALIRLRGENKSVVAHDTMKLAPTSDGGTEISYVAEFQFNGLAKFVAPLARPAFRKLGDEAADGLRAALQRS